MRDLKALLRLKISIGLLVLATPVHAGIVAVPGSRDLQGSFAKSDVVVRGRVASVQSEGTTGSYLRQTAFIIVDRTYKGDAQQTSVRASFDQPADPNYCSVNPCLRLHEGDYRLFFLKRIDTSLWISAEDSPISVPSVKEAGSRSSSPVASLVADMLVGATSPSRDDRVAALQILCDLRAPTEPTRLSALLPASDAEERGWILLTLLRSGRNEILPSVAAYLDVSSTDPRVRSVQAVLLGQLSSLRDRKAARLLERMSESRNQDVRARSVEALRNIADPESLPILIRRLDDSIQAIRYDALMGIGDIAARDDLRPSFEAFRKNELPYLAAAREWWSERQSSNAQPKSKNPQSSPQ
jgi:hypothetical protein